jgi:hypothetical protein
MRSPRWGKAVRTAGRPCTFFYCMMIRCTMPRGILPLPSLYSGGDMNRKGHRQAKKARVLRAAELLFAWFYRRHTLSFLAATVLLLNAAVPYWHAGQRLQAWASAYAEPQAKHDAMPSAELECHHGSSSVPEQKDSNQPPLQKQACPLCKALLLFSPGAAAPAMAFAPCAPPAAVALAAPPAEPTAAARAEGQARPRAPPLA